MRTCRTTEETYNQALSNGTAENRCYKGFKDHSQQNGNGRCKPHPDTFVYMFVEGFRLSMFEPGAFPFLILVLISYSISV